MNIYLVIAAILSGIASLLHLGCIVFGAPWYRFLGTGKKMAALADQGSLTPTLITLFIVLMLSVWSAYAFSAAGVIQKLPCLRLALVIITAIYCVRAIAGFFLIKYPLGNSPQFWLWSSAICLVFGLFHVVGLYQQWAQI